MSLIPRPGPMRLLACLCSAVQCSAVLYGILFVRTLGDATMPRKPDRISGLVRSDLTLVNARVIRCGSIPGPLPSRGLCCLFHLGFPHTDSLEFVGRPVSQFRSVEVRSLAEHLVFRWCDSSPNWPSRVAHYTMQYSTVGLLIA